MLFPQRIEEDLGGVPGGAARAVVNLVAAMGIIFTGKPSHYELARLYFF
jgi:hypothetical protein